MQELETLFNLNVLWHTIPVDKTMIWVYVELAVIILIWILIYFKRSSIKIAFEMFYEFMYWFFEEILWKNEQKWIKWTVTNIFFVILIANLLGRIWDILAVWIEPLEKWFSPFSSWKNWVFAMSLSIVVLVFIINILKNWVSTFYNYVPFWWKWFLTAWKYEWWNKILYYIKRFFMKIFDIIISMFIWMLDIVGDFIAKPISLAFRLFWNMFAWTVLLVLLVWATWALFEAIIWINLPLFLPLILFVQWLLVANIQAFVVALLSSIFIKMVSWESENQSDQ